MLFLRTCKKDGTSYGGYKWNLEIGAINEAEDFNDRPSCGGGLHGIKNGIGDAGYLDLSDESIGVVFSAENDIIEFDGKAKVRTAQIEFVGELSECAAYIHDQTHLDGIIKQTATAGYCGTATAGDFGTATAGYCGTATAGDGGTATAGNRGTATAGNRGTATAGYGGTLKIKYWIGTRYKFKIGYCGEDKIKPNTTYKLNDKNNFFEVKD
jgi:hypothetical protein